MSSKHAGDLTIEHALLGFVWEQPLHGYEIYQQLQAAQALGLAWRLKQANLYAILGKLEDRGLIAAQHIPQETRPAKRLLSLTEQGRTAFGDWVRQPVAHGRDLRVEFLAKLFWAQQLGSDVTSDLIAAQRTTCRAWLTQLQDEATRTTEPYSWLVLQFRLGQIEAMLRWLDTCEQTLVIAAFQQ